MADRESNRRRCDEAAARKALVGPPIGAMEWELHPPVPQRPKVEPVEWELNPKVDQGRE